MALTSLEATATSINGEATTGAILGGEAATWGCRQLEKTKLAVVEDGGGHKNRTLQLPRVQREEELTEVATTVVSGFSLATLATGEEEKSDLAYVWCLAEGKNNNRGREFGNFTYIDLVIFGFGPGNNGRNRSVGRPSEEGRRVEKIRKGIEAIVGLVNFVTQRIVLNRTNKKL